MTVATLAALMKYRRMWNRPDRAIKGLPPDPDPQVLSALSQETGQPLPDILTRLQSPQTPEVAIFVHGIFSSGIAAFREMRADFSRELPSVFTAYYDYDFHADLAKNGKHLAALIAQSFFDCRVTLVCHSMGGLVGRLAVLNGNSAAVHRLIMIGTPNFGALRTAQLGLLSQLALFSTGKLWGVFRKPGLKQLTQTAEVFRDPIANHAQNADRVEYVTIPGAFFHEGRRVWEIGEWGDWQLWSASFAALNFGSELLTAVMPIWKVGLEKPHDGIVEIRSNKLSPAGYGHSSEKSSAIDNPAVFGRTYIHVEPAASERLTHVAIQHHPDVIALVRGIVSAPTLTAWHAGLDKAGLRQLHIEFPG